MKKSKKIALACGGGCLAVILISILLLVMYTAINSTGLRSNLYIYDSQWLDGDSWRWNRGEFLLWHGDESFELIYCSTRERWSLLDEQVSRNNLYERISGINIERIGRVNPLPVLNEERPFDNFIRSAVVYEIEGLDSNEWIYVIYVQVWRANPSTYRHRIYKSTDLLIENPLEFLEEHFDSLQSIRQ